MLTPLLALILSTAAPQSSADPCAGSIYASRIAASPPEEAARVLIQASQSAAPDDLACFQALAEDREAREDWLTKRPFQAARAAIALRRGDPREAIAILEPMVGHQHHTVSIAPDFHALLSRAYDAVGRYDEAEGQRRLALATAEAEPAFALTPEDLRDLPAREPAFGLLPLDAPNPEQDTLDLSSLSVTADARRYATVRLLPVDQDGVAAVRVEREVDCASRRGRAVEVILLRADGTALRREAVDDDREPYNALIMHRYSLVCAADPAERAEPADVVAALTLFRTRRAD